MTVKPVGFRDPQSARSTRSTRDTRDTQNQSRHEPPANIPDRDGPAGCSDPSGAEFPYSLESVGQARRILGGDLRRLAVAPPAADDAVLILSELVSNALRHARPLAGGKIRVAWWMEDSRVLRIAVTDGGRPEPEPEVDGWYASDAEPYADPDHPDGYRSAASPGHPAGTALIAVALDEVDESAVDGRGLGIVGVLADAWGVEPFREPAFAADGTALADPEPVDDPSAPKTVWASVRVHARHAAPPPTDDKRNKSRRDRGGPPRLRGRPRGRLRVLRTALAALWPSGAHGVERPESTAWVPRYLTVLASRA
jgi:hypothetical protein